MEAKLSSRGSTSVATCIRLCLVCPSCLLGAACKSLACVRLCPRGQSFLYALSTGCGPNACDIHTSYVSGQYTSFVGDNAAPCLLRGLATNLPPEETLLLKIPSGEVCSGLDLTLGRRAIPFHMPWRHPDSCIIDKVPTNFNQSHVDQLKAHIFKLRDIPEGVLVRSGLSRVWCNPICDPVLRRSNNTVMSIYDFLCMPSLDKATIREEPHRLDTCILGRVADRTTSPAPAGTAIPRASLEEITVTRPDHKVVTKADHAAKRKASTGPKISTNAAKKTRSSKKGSGAGSSRLAARDEVEQTDDGTLDDDDQRDGSEFAMEDIGNLNDVSQGEHINVIPLRTFDPSLGLDVTYPPILLPDKEVEAHAELSGGVRRATRASFHTSHGVSEDASSPAQEAVPALDTQPLDADAGADEIASDGNVDPYYEARVSNTVGDVLERDLLPFIPGPYYIPYPYDEGSGKLYKDPKVCRTVLDRFPTPAETHRLRELSSVELSGWMSVLQCQLITHGIMLNSRYDHTLKNIERLSKQYAQQMQTIKKQRADLKQQNESTVRANEEVSRLKAELGVLKSRCQTAGHKLSSWDKKHKISNKKKLNHTNTTRYPLCS
ncbi:hypothetical protein Tco_0511894 [Tanacetum coccineum]